MSNESITSVGEVLGLPMPENARLNIGVHGLTAGQLQGLVEQALDTPGLSVEPKTAGGWQWVTVTAPTVDLTLFTPDDYRVQSAFDELVERRLAGTKFIEIPVTAAAVDLIDAAVGQR
jgi:hypothetical protein